MAEPELTGREKGYVNKAIEELEISGHSKYVGIFEEQFAKYIGTKYSLLLPNGTLTLHLALRAMGVDEDSEVIVPSQTISSVAFSISYLGATMVVVDVDPDTWCMDMRAAVRAITSRTKVIMPTHIYGGIPCKIEEIKDQINPHLVYVLEDAAEALGSEHLDRKVGAIGDAGSFSLFANKNMTCLPAGTLISTWVGKTKIENMRVGDLVLCCENGDKTPYQKITGKIALDAVTKVISRVSDDLRTLFFSNGFELTVTGNHEIYVERKGWIRSESVLVGDNVILFNQKQLALHSVKVIDNKKENMTMMVYNLETDRNHNYFADNVLVHNCGEGGVITTSNDKLYEKMRYLRNMAYGPIPETRFWANDLGYNYRSTGLQASFALGQLEGIDMLLKRRQDIHKWYLKYLSKDYVWQKVDENDKVCWWMNAVLVPQKDGRSRRSDFMKFLMECGIESRPTFPPLSQHSYLKKYGVISKGEDNSQYIWENGVLLPSGGAKLTEEKVAYICEKAYKFLKI